MSSEKPHWRARHGDTIAALGVIASLIFVGLEIRQNTAATEGATLQAISDTHTQILLGSAWDEDFIRIYNRALFEGQEPDDFTPEENLQLQRYYIAYLSHLENTYLQNQRGLVDEFVFESYGWQSVLWRTPHFRAISERLLSVGVSSGFSDFFNERTAHLTEFSRGSATIDP